jgi:hypothetical protein
MTLIGPTPLPRLEDQARFQGWPFGYYVFPDASPAHEYFNPALVEWEGVRWLLVRRRVGPVGQPGTNTIEAWKDVDRTLSERKRLSLSTDPQISVEDPRAFIRGQVLILSFCVFLPGSGFAHQSMTGIRPGWVVEPPVSIEIGSNGPSRDLNKGHEKNWCPFLADGLLCISYDLSNGFHIVVETKGAKARKIHYGRSPTWPFGVLRGGTCAVLHDNLFWTFFHSATPWYCGKRRYHMGVLAFQPVPPFHVVRMSRHPLLSASERDFRNIHAPPCVWPGGAVLRDNVWTVSLGVNDNSCAWVEIPHRDVEKACYVTA